MFGNYLEVEIEPDHLYRYASEVDPRKKATKVVSKFQTDTPHMIFREDT